MRELSPDDLHPCECGEKYIVFSNEDFEWIKREYYEATRYYFCRRCDCSWKRVTWCVGQHSKIVITEEPWPEEEE